MRLARGWPRMRPARVSYSLMLVLYAATRSLSEEGERAGHVPRRVQRRAFLQENTNDTPSTKRLGIYLPLDLENIQRKKDNLADTSQAAGSCLHHHLALPLTKSVRTLRSVVPRKDVPEPWLSTVLAHPLGDLVSCSITTIREEREQLRPEWCRGVSIP